MKMKADIKFCDGSVHRCVGRVVDGQSEPWKDLDDIVSHIAYINQKFTGMEIVKIIVDGRDN